MSASETTTHPHWDAQLYEAKHAFVWQQAASLVELLAPRPAERILDLGCGTGHLTAQIAQAGAAVTGVDSSAEMIDQARRNYPELRFEIVDARALGYDHHFDAVFSNAALHWINEAESVVRGVARALKPGGRFVAEFGGKNNVKLILEALQHATQTFGLERTQSPWYFPGIAEYTGLLERSGMEVTFAVLFDRPTPLERESGMRHWVTMFGGHFLSRVPTDRQEAFLRRIEEELRPALHRDGSWFADYRRLRIVARTPL